MVLIVAVWGLQLVCSGGCGLIAVCLAYFTGLGCQFAAIRLWVALWLEFWC